MKREETKGITTERRRPVVVPQPYSPENKSLSRDEFIKRRNAQKAAAQAAEDARLKVLREHGIGPNVEATNNRAPQKPTVQKHSPDVSVLDQKRRELAEVLSALEANPDDKGLKIKRGKLNAEIDRLEDQVDYDEAK